MLKSTVLFLAIFALSYAQNDDQKEEETVKVLNLSNQKLTSLADHDFSKYRNLEELDLSNNDIEFLKEDTFLDNVHLKKLNLSGNANLKLPEFSTLLNANIEEIDLSHCNIEELPANIFDGVRDLKVIDLSGNPLIEEDSVSENTLMNLMSPKKLILPYVDEVMIKRICNEVDITIGIKSDDYTDSILCEDVRTGTWKNIPKESDDNVNVKEIETNDKIDPEANTEAPQSLPSEIPEQTVDVTQMESTENNNDKDGVNADHTVTNKTENTEVENETESLQIETPQDNNNNNLEEETNTENVNNELITETPQLHNVDPNIEFKLKGDEENVNASPAEVPVEGINIKLQNNVPDAIDGKSPSSANEDEKNKKEENKEVPPTMQRGVVKIPSQSENIVPEQTPSLEKKQEQKMGNLEDQAKENKAAEASGTGSSILVILVVAVVVAGAVAFGYKFYKTRKYQATRTTEPVERELKEIVVDRKSNGTSRQDDTIEEKEEEPLMEKHENSVEIKEIDETNENDISKNEISVVPNEIVKSNPLTSSPYVPTTTSIKPSSPTSPNNSDNDKTQI